MKIRYNSPVILTFTIICAAILLIDTSFMSIMNLFTVCPIGATTCEGCLAMGWGNISSYFRLFSHALGHGGMEHLVGNLTFILLIGPIVEEKYGSASLLFMMIVTAGVTGVLQVFLIPGCLLGASGIVFLLIVLSSFTNFKKGGIPLTFILVVILFLGKEVMSSFGEDSTSQFAHLIGGILGGIFGFISQGGKEDVSPKV